MRRLAATALAALALTGAAAPLAAARPAHATAPAAAAAKAIRTADALALSWGRCPTARPAARVLAAARASERPVPRLRRARAAVAAWTAVAEQCARPVAQPTVGLSS
jgi:hypothetical protein